MPAAANPKSARAAGTVIRCRRVLAAALATLFGAGLVAAADHGPSIDEVNRRWSGAVCRTRIPLELKKRSDKDGWTKGPWVWIEQPKTKYRLFVRERSAVEHLLVDGDIPPGTALTAEGWRLESPERGHGLVMDLRFADVPAELRFEFYGAWTRLLSVERLGEMERLMRFTILEILSAPDEQLVEVDIGGPGREGRGSPPSRPTPSHPTAAAASSRPELRMVAVGVEPLQAAPGEEISLVLTFAVDGAPPGSGLEVVERREILSGDTRLTVLEERLQRGNGTFTSRQPVQMPAGLAPGVYTLRASVSAAGQRADGSALFQVVAH